MVRGKKEKISEESRIKAFVASFLSIGGVILALIFWRKDKYVMYYASQSLVIFLASLILTIPLKIFEFVPVIGPLIDISISVLIFLAWIFSWVYALSYQKKVIPIVSDIAKKFKF